MSSRKKRPASENGSKVPRAGCADPHAQPDCEKIPDEVKRSLVEMAKWYRKCYQDNHAADIKDFSEEDFSEVVRRSVLGETSDNKIHGHQRRPGRKILQDGVIRLQPREQDLRAARDFEELYQIVNNTIRPVYKIGEMAVYDAALRIGAHLGIYPRLVYLHRGARDGACKLGLAKTTTLHLPVSVFPKPLHELEPHEIEDFLCIFKNDFNELEE